MIKKHFIIVIVSLVEEINANRQSKFEKIFDKAIDWMPISTLSWLLWTSSSSKLWYQRLKPLLNEGDLILITEANLSDRAGFLPKTTWRFVKRYQNN